MNNLFSRIVSINYIHSDAFYKLEKYFSCGKAVVFVILFTLKDNCVALKMVATALI